MVDFYRENVGKDTHRPMDPMMGKGATGNLITSQSASDGLARHQSLTA